MVTKSRTMQFKGTYCLANTTKGSFIEKVVERCFIKYVFRKIEQNLQENTGVVFFF